MKWKIIIQCGVKVISKISGGTQNDTEKILYPANLRKMGKMRLISTYGKVII